jgi:hypothetical protein
MDGATRRHSCGLYYLYLTSTSEQLRGTPSWTSLGHPVPLPARCSNAAVSPVRLDYWFGLLPPATTHSAAQAVDAALCCRQWRRRGGQACSRRTTAPRVEGGEGAMLWGASACRRDLSSGLPGCRVVPGQVAGLPGWCRGGAGVVPGWCRGGAGVVPGWCRGGAGVPGAGCCRVLPGSCRVLPGLSGCRVAGNRVAGSGCRGSCRDCFPGVRSWTTSTAGRQTARATQACVSRCRVTSSARAASLAGTRC